jgi:hypothetical protein
MMASKKCGKCDQDLSVDFFRICHDKRGAKPCEYYCSKCKSCEKKAALEYYHNNKEKSSQSNKQYKRDNAEHIRELRKQYLEKTKEHVKERYKEYCENNRSKLNDLAKQYKDKHIHIQIHHCLSTRLRDLITKEKRTCEYLGTSIDTIMKWFEFNFDENLTWENRSSTWHIDHTIPANRFDMQNNDDISVCFSWMNLMPLDRKKNIAKSDKILMHRIFLQEIQLRKFAKKYELEAQVLPYIEIYKNTLFRILKSNTSKLRETP